VSDANIRSSIDENSSYDDLLRVCSYSSLIDSNTRKNSFQEIIALRKEKEQDKQTIKLLQEQMVCF
jgi:hypothetical protein